MLSLNCLILIRVHASVDGAATDDTGAAWMVDQYATFNGPEEGKDLNLDGINEDPFQLLYMGAGQPDTASVTSLGANTFCYYRYA